MAVGQFIAGFSECIRQIQKFNNQEDGKRSDGDLQHKMIDFLLSYLKNFSDDATRALQTRSPLSPDVKRSRRSLKSSSGDSGFCAASPTSPHHSPTSSSLSPKSPALSPGGSSDCSAMESPRKPEAMEAMYGKEENPRCFVPDNNYLTLYVPSSASQAINSIPSSLTQGESTLLQRLQMPPSLIGRTFPPARPFPMELSKPPTEPLATIWRPCSF